ncbi:hypothetical protein [Brevundimonas sp.]|uniref:hypothetical protein n=1 Tax=Brevundimonas sp. TaxID=1871086 RepID=UPI002E120280|nr:hypothetical protein [Brevundimonas sp.]
MAGRRVHSADLATAWVVFGMLVAGALAATIGPTRSLPVGWGLDGGATGFAPRETVGLMLIGAAVLIGLIGVGLGMAARTAADPAAGRGLRVGQIGLVVVCALVVGLWALAGLNGVVDLARPLPLAILATAGLLVAALLVRLARGLRAWHRGSGPSRD